MHVLHSMSVTRGLTSVTIGVGLPFGLGGLQGTWEADSRQRAAAWKMYVELVTRSYVDAEAPDDGLLREALSSLYSLFGTTRDILREHGPVVAHVQGRGRYAFGHVAVAVLNNVLRPVLSKWHPLLECHELGRPPWVPIAVHERSWSRHDELRRDLRDVRLALQEYARLLAGVAGVPSLTETFVVMAAAERDRRPGTGRCPG